MKRQRYKDLQLVQLRSFCLAATQGNFSEAAKVAGVSRAAVWQQVRALERKLGLTLLRRKGRTVELTQDGRLVLEVVLPHVNGLDSIERLIETKREELPRRLTVACTPGLLAYDVARPLQHFARAQPACRVNLLSETIAEQLMRRVESGEADVGVFTHDPSLPRSPYLDYEELFTLQLLLLTSEQHPLARKRRVQASDLADQPILLGSSAGVLRRVQDRILQESSLVGRVQVAMETEHTYLVLKYVSLG
ncbi:MAG: LysR family transcriptional regulator, partial [Gemmataceae bacterium]